MTKKEMEEMEVVDLMDKLAQVQAYEQMIKDVIRAKIYSVEKPR